MKDKIHPKYYPNAKVTCACGNSFETGSTKEAIRLDICSACHPFFTGEMRIVDTAGQVERFFKRLERRESKVVAQPAAVSDDKGRGKKKIVYEMVDEDQSSSTDASQ
jgi:large subunit ribosomal protein L31